MSDDKVTLNRPVINKTIEKSADKLEEIVVEKNDAVWKQEISAAKQQEKSPEVVTKEETSKISKSNISEYVSIHNGTLTEFVDEFETLSNDPEEFKKQVNDSESYLSKLIKSSKTSTSQFEFLKESLDRLNATNQQLLKSTNERKDKTTSGKQHGGIELSGKDSKLSVIARTRGLKKLMLYNSAFYILIRPFTLSELNEIFNSVDDDSKEFGRILGGHFHLISDIFIKQKFMELFVQCVVGSNLKDYKKQGVLASAIKLQDYDVLLWGCCSLLFKEGVNIELVCVNPECKHVESDLFIDLNETRLNNFDIVAEDVIEAVVKGEPVTLNKLLQIQDKLHFDKKIKVGNEVYHLKVPSMEDYLNNGLSLIAKIISAVNGETSIDDAKMQTQVTIYLYQVQLPWVDKVEFLNEDGEVDFFTKNKDAISEALDTDRHEKGDFYTQLKKFITDTKITYICYSSIKCKQCGKTPTNDLEDYFPVDVQLLFFYLCCQLLQLAGVRFSNT